MTYSRTEKESKRTEQNVQKSTQIYMDIYYVKIMAQELVGENEPGIVGTTRCLSGKE